jgi:hypothetical protein
MFTSQVRVIGIVFASLLVVASGVWLSSGNSVEAQVEQVKDARLKDLLKEKLSVLQKVASQTATAHQNGARSFAQVHEANQAVRYAELDLCDNSKERVAVLEKLLAEAKGYEDTIFQQVKTGAVQTSTALKAKVNRLDVEIALERAKGK